MKDALVYRIAGDRLWDVDEARYIETADSEKHVMHLVTADGDDSEDYLIRTLEFYGYPLGELTDRSVKGLKAKLDELDAKYLTPRVLAGLVTQDEYAKAQWEAHEAEAAPLRAKLAGLTAE